MACGLEDLASLAKGKDSTEEDANMFFYLVRIVPLREIFVSSKAGCSIIASVEPSFSKLCTNIKDEFLSVVRVTGQESTKTKTKQTK